MFKHGISRKDHIVHENKKFNSGKWRNTVGRKVYRDKDIDLIKQSFGDLVEKVLCIGARHVSEVNHFKDNFKEVVGIDIVENSPGILKIDAHDMLDHFKERHFDFVYSSHSLEHMVDAEKVIKNIRAVSKIGCLITLPIFNETYNSHCTLFDICKFLHENQDHDNKALEKRIHPSDEIFNDFKNLGNYTIEYFKVSKDWNEFTAIFRWDK